MLDDLKNILEKRTDFSVREQKEKIKKQERERPLDNDFQKEQIAGAEQEKIKSENKNIASGATATGVKLHPLQKSLKVDKIENILSEGLEEVYASLPERKRFEFKKKGEETAFKIFFILKKTKVKAKKIIKLIKQWLKMIPGINRFFLEQEAKIKADKIIEIK